MNTFSSFLKWRSYGIVYTRVILDDLAYRALKNANWRACQIPSSAVLLIVCTCACWVAASLPFIIAGFAAYDKTVPANWITDRRWCRTSSSAIPSRQWGRAVTITTFIANLSSSSITKLSRIKNKSIPTDSRQANLVNIIITR